MPVIVAIGLLDPEASSVRSEPARSANWKRDVVTVPPSGSYLCSRRNAKQCVRDELSFRPVPAVFREAMAVNTASRSSSHSSTSSSMPYSTGGFFARSRLTP